MADSDPVIRGAKVPLAWSTVKATGYVVEKFDEDEKVDQVLLEDEDSQYCTEITMLRQQTERTIEVMPLTGLATPPEAGDLFVYDTTKKFSITSIKKNRAKGGAVKWTLTGNFLPYVHTA
jgi:hypothetical protein